jgi:formylglycine-generating enzyme required for sulfatase activity
MSLLDPVPTCAIIPEGPFLMGTPDAERSALAKRYGGTRESYAEESPQHEVSLPAFAMMCVPVTNRLYAQFVDASGAHVPVTWHGATVPPELVDHPVVDVSWYDALAFANWLSHVTDMRWVLPAEAQWEKAARGVEGRRFPWGNTFDATYCNVRESGYAGTTPVGCYAAGASPYGLLDMAGNVWEWTRSCQAPYPYVEDGRNRVELPTGQGGLRARIAAQLRRSAPDTPLDTRRVLRGGCYANPEGFARCACRFRLAPTSRTPFLGFRLVRDV